MAMDNDMTEPVPVASRPVPDPTKLTTDAVDRATEALTELFDVKLETMEVKLEAEMRLTRERFSSINLALEKVEAGRLEQKGDTRLAVQAALTVQEQAIEQMKETFDTAIGSMRIMVADQSQRLGKMEGRESGGQRSTDNSRASSNLTIAYVAAAVAFCALVVGVIGILTGFSG